MDGDQEDEGQEDDSWKMFTCVSVVVVVGWVLSFGICVVLGADLMRSMVIGMISAFVIGTLSAALYAAEISETEDQISGS